MSNSSVDSIIRQHVIWSIGGGLIPVPLVDILAVTGIQVEMIRSIAREYGHDASDDQAKMYLSALGGGVAARLAANAVKLIPVIGSVVGGISMAAMSGASTYAVGKVMQSHFEQGGTAYNFDSSKFKDFYDEQIQRGKEFVDRLKDEQKSNTQKSSSANTGSRSNSSSNPQTDEIVERIKELKDMRDAGILSEEEFTSLKAKLLNKI